MSIFSRKTEAQVPLQDHTIYLIDTENVRTVWTLLLDRMTLNDKIYVFYTMNSGNVSYEDLNGVISSGKNVELIQCHTGKNGLDFQLVSYLGYLIRNNENADYCIISDDSGYDAVIKFWEGREVKVSRKTAFQVSGKQAKVPKKPLFGVKPRAKVPAKTTAQAKTAEPKKTEDKGKTPETPKVSGKSEAMKPAEQKKSSEPKKAAEPKKVSDPGKVSEPKKTDEVKKTSETGNVAGQVKATANKKSAEASIKADCDKAVPAKKPSTEKKNSGEKKPVSSKKSSPEKRPDVTPANVSRDKLKEFLPDETEERISQISEIIKKSGGKKGLADIHDEIEKLYRNEQASDIYRIIRHNIKDICC